MNKTAKTAIIHYSILIAVLLIVACIPGAHAAGILGTGISFNRYAPYDSSAQVYEIKSAILGIPTGDIATVKLNTPKINYVMPGRDRLVAEMTVDLSIDEYENPFDGLELYDVNTGERIDRAVTLKYKTLESYYISDFDTICIDTDKPDPNSLNGSMIATCHLKEIGRHVAYKETWNNFDSSKIIKGNVTIGLFTNVYSNDNVEWIYDDLLGIRADSWAVWTSSLSVGLEFYYNMTNSTEMISGRLNLTVDTGAPKFTQDPNDCLAGLAGCMNVSAGNNYNISNRDLIGNFTVNKTMNFWFKSDTEPGGASSGIFDKYGGGGKGYAIGQVSTANRIDLVGWGSTLLCDNVWFAAKWTMLTISTNDTDVLMYVNGSLCNFTTYGAGLAGAGATQSPVFGGDNNYFGGELVGSFDEFGWWNRTLSSSELSDNGLFNGGAGLTYTSLVTILNSPGAYYNTTNSAVYFNCSTEGFGSGVLNITLIIDGLDNYTLTNSSANQNLSLYLSRTLSENTHNWTCRGSDGIITSTAVSRNVTYVKPSFNFCNTTANKARVINITFKDESPPNSFMNASMDSATFYYWFDNQNVNSTYYFSNASENYEYDFCLYPSYTPNVTTSYYLQYSSDTYTATTYPQRQYSVNPTTYLNSTLTPLTLYLLSSATGVNQIFLVTVSGGAPISGALIQIERQFAGVGGPWTLITQGFTSTAGDTQFWLDNNYDHRITATKTGYASSQGTIRPSGSIYTIILGTTQNSAYYDAVIQGLTYSLYPQSGMLRSHVYNFSVVAHQSGLYPLQNCSFALLNKTRDAINITYQWTNGTDCNPKYLNYNFTTSIYGAYSVMINGTWFTLESDAHWYLYDINNTGSGLMDFINQSYYLCHSYDPVTGACLYSEWGSNPETNDFSRITFFFLFICVVIAGLNFYTNYDTLYPGASLYIVWGCILLGSFSQGFAGPGFFYLDIINLDTMATPGVSTFASVLNNWIVALFSSMIIISATVMNFRRQEG